MAKSSSIFIVDDDPAIRDSVQAMLDAEGYATKTFETGLEFLGFCQSDPEGCALLDVRMPDINGLDLQIKLREKGIDLPVVIMTGHGDIKMAVQAMRNGASDFIEKPFTKEAIIQSLKTAFNGGRSTVKQSAALDDEARVLVERLTPREIDVLNQLVIGNPNKIIAHELDISPRTVEIHRARVMEKMQARNLSHLVRLAIAAGVQPQSG